jgi:hypothetical protein
MLTANCQNATRSTGRLIPTGKRAASGNVLTQRLFAVFPVLPGEDPAAWENFYLGVFEGLHPVRVLEHESANRIAGLM